MIKQEFFEANGASLVKTYSDSNKKLRQIETGIIYNEAIDIPNHYTYEETDEDIETDEIEQHDKGLRDIHK